MISAVGRRSPFLSLAGLTLGVSCLLTASAPLRADEFSPVPAGDVIYSHLATVTKAGWSGRAGAAKNAPRQFVLTRYEAALETARSLLAVGAQARGDDAWNQQASRPALRALRALTLALRPELVQLDVDVRQSLELLDSLLQAKPGQGRTTATVQEPRPGVSLSAPVALEAPSWRLAPRESTGVGTPASRRALVMPLSQYLRISTAVEMLARDADDLFGTTRLASPSTSQAARRVEAGAALSLTDSLTLRATYENQELEPPASSPFAPRDLLASTFRSGSARALGGGVEIAPLRGVRLSGDVAHVEATDGALDARATRLSGGVAVSAWQNRLSLSANLSRLVPEDSLALAASTSARFDLGVDVTERLRFNLLYQQLFSPETPASRDSFVGVGIATSF